MKMTSPNHFPVQKYILSSHQLILGSWDNGVIHMKLNSEVKTHLFSEIPVVHVKSQGDNSIIGTWGKGLFVIH